MRPIRALGTMSGTSLDGVDAAELWTDGESIARFGERRYRAYDDAERAAIRAALGRWPGEPGVEAAADTVEEAHLALLRQFGRPDLVGFHGQTLAHDPAHRRTHQAGRGDLLAEALGWPVVWDFRTSDVTLGGQGAPLAPAYHHACARYIRAAEPVAFLNLGGVGNLTWVDPTAPMEETGALLAFDTGPANAPIDDLVRARTGARYDAGGVLAAAGRARLDLVGALLSLPYFEAEAPKSLDRDDFAEAGAEIDALPLVDAVASWVAVVAGAVALGLELCPTQPARLLVTGGGRHNAAIMEALRLATLCDVQPVEAVGLDGDMLEAQAFAFLAVRVARGLATSFPGTTGVRANVGGGKISGDLDLSALEARQLAGRRVRGDR
ncbi:anhydro-N-acetylmuramic acid kinase [Jannaschia seohaensis]|uniref:Anhydro-N-acetylmuramic acid kinase n=1 Tax=Jannaschia seohaensis TaxID=475081 RepID=A0A2Y9AQD4_9RHOB|nr:anhydro-N-acetylmuramic acid kinase [Jannaschia seohaensis]PWJ18070.1 anhydro-N-acetylmuramic acid kinase [Jannaschia seohaensis]SSA46594.1 anhydro-N-acetylmuramic acid kinase [Jannaschia seohaensis]